MAVHHYIARDFFQNLKRLADVFTYTLRCALAEVCGIDTTNERNFPSHNFRNLSLIG